MITGRKDPPALWEEFLNLDPGDSAAVGAFIRTRFLIDWAEPSIMGGNVTEPYAPLPWHLSPLARPSEENLMSPDRVPDLHRSFVGAVKDCRRWASADKREALHGTVRDLTRFPEAELFTLIMGLNAEIERTHPRLVIDGDGRFALQLPGPAKGYTTMGDIYFSFIQDLTQARVAACEYCGRLFALSSKQQAALRRKPPRRVFCSPLHRLQFFESSPERKRQKAEAVRRFREAERQKRKPRPKRGEH